MNIRGKISDIADRTGLTSSLLSARAFGRPEWLTVVTWHRIADAASASDVDEGVVDATPEEFRAEVEVLMRHFNIVGLSDVRAALGGKPLPPKPALLTFDDGYVDCAETALPILKSLGARATFFLVTDPIEKRTPFWWDAIAWILKHGTRDRFTVTYPKTLAFSISADGRQSVTRACLDVVKTTFALDVDRFLDGLADAAGAPWDAGVKRSLADRLLMTWDDVRVLDRAGMDIGSHTRTHRVLATLPEADLDAELRAARADLERHVGRAPDAIAYPVGAPVAHLPGVRAALERAGYALGFTYRTGFQRLGADVDPFSLRRIAIDRGTSPERFKSRLATLGLLS